MAQLNFSDATHGQTIGTGRRRASARPLITAIRQRGSGCNSYEHRLTPRHVGFRSIENRRTGAGGVTDSRIYDSTALGNHEGDTCCRISVASGHEHMGQGFRRCLERIVDQGRRCVASHCHLREIERRVFRIRFRSIAGGRYPIQQRRGHKRCSASSVFSVRRVF